MNIICKLKPTVPRRALLFVAAIVWTFAGGILLYKGLYLLSVNPNHLFLFLSCSLLGGLMFYHIVFSRISLKHTRRIIRLKNDNPCFFSFFNLKSYLMMIVMISTGIMLRKFGLVPPYILMLLYLTMGIPLFISAFRFYYHWIFYKNAMNI